MKSLILAATLRFEVLIGWVKLILTLTHMSHPYLIRLDPARPNLI
jgi:hypothetical protein